MYFLDKHITNMYDVPMKKIRVCKACGHKHYAFGYCRACYARMRRGFPTYIKCKMCISRVYSHKKEQLCAYHYGLVILKKRIGKLRSPYKNDGGKWGYKDYRRYIILRKRTCESCGANGKKIKSINLHIHHIDGNPRNPDPSNLQTLCSRCHRNIHNIK